MLKSIFARPERKTMYWIETLRQMHQIGVDSIIIVFIISFFIGAVSAVQFAYNLSTTITPMYFVGYIVKESMIMEFAPTVSALILAGKVGSNIASELGTMRLTEQIDALEIMGVNTTSYLIGPKLLAAITMIPLLVVFAAAIGILGGMLAGITSGYVSSTEYLQGVLSWFVPRNAYIMMIKAFVFSFLIVSISSYKGYYSKGGALEIGKASTSAVVISCISVLVADYLIAWLVL
ncbi:MAG TPA: ABC transporter permease [Chitinophagales bacterium]|nr:ABC transporter permease [Chitinophagales bacterium]